MDSGDRLIPFQVTQPPEPIPSKYYEHTFMALGHVVIVVNEIPPKDIMKAKGQRGFMETLVRTPQGEALGYIDLGVVPFILSKPFYGDNPPWPRVVDPRDEGRI